VLHEHFYPDHEWLTGWVHPGGADAPTVGGPMWSRRSLINMGCVSGLDGGVEVLRQRVETALGHQTR